jgi:hypothetical protein
LFQSWHTWHVGGILVVSLFGPACLSAILFSHNKFFRWRGRCALPPPPFCTGRRSFSGFYRDGGMRRRCITTPQNPKDNLLVASFIFPSHQNVEDEPFSRKSHVICFWDRKGFFLVDFMPKNAEAYCNTLKKLRRAIQNRRRGMLTRGVSLLHHNARPHSAPVSQELLTSFGWDIVTHPPIHTTWRLQTITFSLN